MSKKVDVMFNDIGFNFSGFSDNDKNAIALFMFNGIGDKIVNSVIGDSDDYNDEDMNSITFIFSDCIEKILINMDDDSRRAITNYEDYGYGFNPDCVKSNIVFDIFVPRVVRFFLRDYKMVYKEPIEYPSDVNFNVEFNFDVTNGSLSISYGELILSRDWEEDRDKYIKEEEVKDTFNLLTESKEDIFKSLNERLDLEYNYSLNEYKDSYDEMQVLLGNIDDINDRAALFIDSIVKFYANVRVTSSDGVIKFSAFVS